LVQEIIQDAYRLKKCTSRDLFFFECFQPVWGVMKADKKPRADFLEENISLVGIFLVGTSRVVSPASEGRILIVER